MSSVNSDMVSGSPESEMYRESEGTKIRVSGLADESVITRERIYETITGSIQKMRRVTPVSEISFNVDKHHEKGKRKKYSVKINAVTGLGAIHSGDFEWDILQASKKTLGKLETALMRKEEKSKVRARAP